MHDVIIIGAGIVGCATARELSRYQLDILVVDQEEDVSCGTSKANSGIVHAGHDCQPGTRKAVLNVRGAALFHTLAEELDIPYRNNGALVISLNDHDQHRLQALYEQGQKNGVSGLSLLTAAEALRLEPHLNPDVKAALWVASSGVISPYEATVAFAENAAVNGARFLLGAMVRNIINNVDHFTVETTKGMLQAKTVVNAAGVEADFIHNCVCEQKETIQLQRGQYYLLDNTHQDFLTRTIFQLPTSLGKGVLVTPTVDYNLLVGPNAEIMENKQDTQTTKDGLQETLDTARKSLPDIPINDRITAFAGIRAKHASHDFLIEEPVQGFVNALGIDSPGLSAAPAIGELIAGFITERLQPSVNTDFIKTREGIKRFKSCSFEEQSALIKQNPQYGNVVCRCETVTEGEIIEAIRRPVGARSLDALKRRTRVQMGRCQGGFCTLRLIEILSRELNIEESAVTKNGGSSTILL